MFTREAKRVFVSCGLVMFFSTSLAVGMMPSALAGLPLGVAILAAVVVCVVATVEIIEGR